MAPATSSSGVGLSMNLLCTPWGLFANLNLLPAGDASGIHGRWGIAPACCLANAIGVLGWCSLRSEVDDEVMAAASTHGR